MQADIDYLLGIAAYNQLDDVILYETEMVTNHQATGAGKALETTVEGSNEVMPGAVAYPLGMAMVAVTAPFPYSRNTLMAYTDAYVIDRHAGTFQTFRSLSEVKDIPIRVMGGWRAEERDAYTTLPVQSLQKFIGTLSGR